MKVTVDSTFLLPISRQRLKRIERLNDLSVKNGIIIGALGGLCLGVLAITATIKVARAKTMTTLQKTAIVVCIVILAGAGIYEARRAAYLRDELRLVGLAQAPLSAQVAQLKSERDDSTNRLAGLREENERLNEQLSRSKPELLRLRGEVTLARKELTELQHSTKKMAATEKAKAAMAGLQTLEVRQMAQQKAIEKSEAKIEDLIKDLHVPNEIVSAAYGSTTVEGRISHEYVKFFEAVRELQNQKTFLSILEKRIAQEREYVAQETAR